MANKYSEEEKLIAGEVKLECLTHMKELIAYCLDCKVKLCEFCFSDHQGHNIVEVKDCQEKIQQSIKILEPDLVAKLDQLSKLKLPKSQMHLDQVYSELESARMELTNLVSEYFKELKENFTRIMTNFPSEESKTLFGSRIEQMQQEFKQFQKLIDSNKLAINDIANFYERNYDQDHFKLEQELNNLSSLQKTRFLDPDNLPYFRIEHSAIEKILFNLNEYVTPVFPGQVDRKFIEKIKIQAPNFYSNSTPLVAYIDDSKQTVQTYNLKSHQQKVIDYNAKQDGLNYSSSYLVTPENNLFVCGGVNNRGEIRGNCYSANLNSETIEPIPEMIVKRVAHTICYIHNAPENYQVSKINQSAISPEKQLKTGDNSMLLEKQKSGNTMNINPTEIGEGNNSYVYVVGGKTNVNVRTRLCERYSFRRKTWEKVAMLNKSRSRCALASFDDKFIYAFYGTNAFGKSEATIEKLDIEHNEWKIVEVLTQMPGFDVTTACACQINSEQIIILGGFRDSMFFQDFKVFNRKVMAFNVPTETISIYNSNCPVDFIPEGQIVINQQHAYALGSLMQNIGEQERLYFGAKYLLDIGNEKIQVEAIVSSAEGNIINYTNEYNNTLEKINDER